MAHIAGRAVIERDPQSVDLAVRLYARRYRQPRENPIRVVIRIDSERVLGSAACGGRGPAGADEYRRGKLAVPTALMD